MASKMKETTFLTCKLYCRQTPVMMLPSQPCMFVVVVVVVVVVFASTYFLSCFVLLFCYECVFWRYYYSRYCLKVAQKSF